MAVNKGEIGIYGVLRNDTPENILAKTDQLYDTPRGKTQEKINSELTEEIQNIKDTTLTPDEEDITATDLKLQFKDRPNTDGMGYTICRKKKPLIEQISQANTIYEIRYNFDLGGGTLTIPNNCVLKFNGGSISNGTLVSTNTYIQAAPYLIFNDIVLKGNYLNNFLVEWWGAASYKDHNEVYINNAISSFAEVYSEEADKRYSNILVLSGVYEINDTIFLNGYVSILGSSIYTRSKYQYPNGTLLINFSEQDKWAIDIKDKNGDVLECQYLYLSPDSIQNYYTNLSYNINGIHLRYKEGAKPIYGGIRIANLIHSNLENIDISAITVVGMAVLCNSWNVSFHNILIYASKYSLYLGDTITTVTFSNTYLLHSELPSAYDYLSPIILETSKVPYANGQELSSALVMEGAAATFYGCIFQGFEALVIGTDYSAYFSSPYIEQISKTFVWLYNTKIAYGTDTRKKHVIINNNQLGVWQTELYSLGTVRGLIEVHNFMYATCYTPSDESWTYASYYIHVNEASANDGCMYYDDFTIGENGEVTNTYKSRYKKIILDKDSKSIYTDVYIRPFNSSTVKYYNNKLLSGYSNQGATTLDEIIRREYDYVNIVPAVNNTPIIVNNTPIVGKHLNWKTTDISAHQALFQESIQLVNSSIKFVDCLTNGNSNYFQPVENYEELPITSYFIVSGNSNTILFTGRWTIGYNIPLLTLSGESEVKVDVVLDGNFSSDMLFSSIERCIKNPDFSYPYEVNIYINNSFNSKVSRYKYTNTSRPTSGLYKGFRYYDTSLSKPVYWNGTEWVTWDDIEALTTEDIQSLFN